MVEEAEKSKERPIQGNYPGVCLGGSYSSLVRRGVQQRRLRPQADYNMQYEKFTT